MIFQERERTESEITSHCMKLLCYVMCETGQYSVTVSCGNTKEHVFHKRLKVCSEQLLASQVTLNGVIILGL
jgi:hypothetical protein